MRPRRPVRGVRHGGVAVVAAAAQPRRPYRDRQPVRPSAVAAGAAGHRRGAGGAAGVDGVRQLLREAAVAHVRRRDCGVGRDGDAAPHGGPARVRRGGRGHVLVGRAGHGRSRSRAAPRAAGADGAFADPDRHGLRVRPLPDLPDRAGTADRLPAARYGRRGELLAVASSFAAGDASRSAAWWPGMSPG